MHKDVWWEGMIIGIMVLFVGASVVLGLSSDNGIIFFVGDNSVVSRDVI